MYFLYECLSLITLQPSHLDDLCFVWTFHKILYFKFNCSIVISHMKLGKSDILGGIPYYDTVFKCIRKYG